MLAAQLEEQLVLELAQRTVLVARYRNGTGLVSGRVGFDVVLERVVIDIICPGEMSDLIHHKS